MRTDQPVTIRRSDYTPPPFLIDQVVLRVELDPDQTRVQAELDIRRNPAGDPSASLLLDGEDLELIEVRLDGETLPAGRWRIDEAGLRVDDAPDHFRLLTISRTRPSANTTLSGLYLSNGNFFTQCEAEGFRRITWFADRPDVMARYTVTLCAPRDRFPVLLSNGNLVATVERDDGWTEATWLDPFPKPSYLFALVAGNLVATERRLQTRSGREVLLQVWVEPGNERRTGHAMESLVRSIRWDEERFGLELDLDRFMIVAVADFNMGAMENKGLNIFNSKYVFADPRLATDQDFAAIESIVAHEYFHNWTGNRITCRSWFELTLKEGLTVFRDQEFSADMMAAQAPDARAAQTARAVKRIADVRMLRSGQFPEDAGPMAHPIRPDSYQEINNFYTLTVYEKGAEVIRMLQTMFGVDGFRKGMDLYVERHDGQAVSCDDFVAAIADANQADLGRFSRWYSQAGTPRLSISTSHDPHRCVYRIEIRQSCQPSPGQPDKLPFPIPFAIGLVGPHGNDLDLVVGPGSTGHLRRLERGGNGQTAILDLNEALEVFEFTQLPDPPIPSFARNFSAPVIIEHDFDDDQLAFLARHDSDPFNRWDAGQRLAVRCVLSVVDGADPDERCEALVASIAQALDDRQLDPAYLEQLLSLPAEGFIAEQLPVVDAVVLRAAREAVRSTIAGKLADRWERTWHDTATDAAWTADLRASGRRALANAALGFWVVTGDQAAIEAAVRRFERSDNMTDRSAALQALMLADRRCRDEALERFAVLFADEPLAIDKWYSMQAIMHRLPGDPPVLDRVRSLAGRADFSLRNPNRARSLIGSFCHGNLAEFHAPDANAYDWWAERVLEIDALNPQLAARLARALDRWRKFTPDRQQAMKVALGRVASAQSLSRDVREIVTKALAA
jgi:aminopeptidase N